MPQCIVYGPGGADITSIVTQSYPEATITRFDENDGSITIVFPADPTDTINRAGLHVIMLETDLNSVVWRPFTVRSSPGAVAGTEEKIAQILRQRFNGQGTNERALFRIPVPIPTFADSLNPGDKYNHERSILVKMIGEIWDVMSQNGILAEIGLARW